MKFWIYYTGTRNGRWIEAENMLSAKWIFALQEGARTLAHISASRRGPACDTWGKP